MALGGEGGARAKYTEPVKRENTPSDNLKILKDNFSYEEKFSKRTHSNAPKLWQKGDKERYYIPKNAYEDAGYVTKNATDIYGRNSGEHKGWGYSANKPGGVSSLKDAIDKLNQ